MRWHPSCADVIGLDGVAPRQPVCNERIHVESTGGQKAQRDLAIVGLRPVCGMRLVMRACDIVGADDR